MNITVGGEDNPALDVESRKEAELVRISEDTTAKKKVVVVSKKQNVFEMTTIGRNEPAAKTEQAINPNKLSDAIMLQRSLYFMGGGAIISFLIATTALVLVLIIMSQSPSITLKDPGTVHARSLSSPIDQGIKNLTKSLQKAQIELENIWMVINSTAKRTSNLASKVFHLEKLNKEREHKENKTKDLSLRLELTQRELKSFRDQITVRTVALWNSQNSTMAELDKLKTVWTAINTTVEKTSNLTDKIGDEIQTVWLNLNQSKNYTRTLTNYIQSFKENVTYRSLRLEARIEKEEQNSNNTKTVMDEHFKKIQNLEISIHVTRREAEKATWQHSTALWSAVNFTSREFHRLWTVVNTSQAVLAEKLRKVRDNFARKLNQSIVLLQSSDSSLFSSLVGINETITAKVDRVFKKVRRSILNGTNENFSKITSSIKDLKLEVTHRSLKLEARIEKEEQNSNNTKIVMDRHFKKIQNLEILMNVTRHEAEKAKWQHSMAQWSAGNFTVKEFRRLNQSIVLLQSSDASLFASLVGINATIAVKVNKTVSKMMIPIGPRGFNGSQGPPGPMGSIGPTGPKGTGDLSTCQYKTLKEEETSGSQSTAVRLLEPHGKRVIGVTCSANYGAENNLSDRFHNNIQEYHCKCRKTDAHINPPAGDKRTCFLHYWQCPLTT